MPSFFPELRIVREKYKHMERKLTKRGLNHRNNFLSNNHAVCQTRKHFISVDLSINTVYCIEVGARVHENQRDSFKLNVLV